ncbi:MAG: hypothetical protein ABSE89_00305 [Sedimentisphaerales bacterium]
MSSPRLDSRVEIYINKEKIILFACLILFIHCQNADCAQILEQKIIAEKITDCDMHWAKFLFNNDNALITMRRLLYTNNNLIRTDNLKKYCDILGGYLKDNQFYIVLDDINTVDVYRVQKQLELESYIKPVISEYHHYHRVVLLHEQSNCYYLFGHYNLVAFGPFDSLERIVSAGNVRFKKPLLAKIQDNKIVRCIKLDYGGKRDESYVVEEAMGGKDSIHFFGFRNIDVPFMDNGRRAPIKLVEPGRSGYNHKRYTFDTGDYYTDRDITQSIMLYYSDYNLKKEKNTRNCKIYENTPGYNERTDTYCDYGVLSTDTRDDDVFAVFSWVKWQRHRAGSTMVEYKGLQHKEGFNLNDVNSSIYFWQCNDKSYGKAEKIAEGFCPLVRVNRFGIVHVFWIDRSGNIVQKVKKDDKWSNEEIILKGINAKPIIYTKYSVIDDNQDKPEAILYTKFFAAEFDKEDNLHAVYPTAEGIVYTKLKLE